MFVVELVGRIIYQRNRLFLRKFLEIFGKRL